MSPRIDNIEALSVHVYFADHRRPHIQVRGPGVRANVDIRTGEVLAGYVPPRELRAVHVWLAPLLWGPAFEPISDDETFAQVRVDSGAGTIVWPGGADISAHTLYAMSSPVAGQHAS